MDYSFTPTKKYLPNRFSLKVANLTYIVFFVVYTIGLLGGRSSARWLVFLPEILGLLFFTVLLFKNKTLVSHPAVYILLGLAVLSIISFQLEGSNPFIYALGMRNYFKFSLFFFIPLMLREPSFNRIKEQFPRFILVVAVLQLPIAVIQKVMYWGRTGDVITGSLGANASGLLSQFLYMTLPLVIALYFEKRINIRQTIILALMIVAPTTINETKMTLIFMAVLIAVYVLISNKIKFKQKIATIVVGGMMMSAFVWAYSRYSTYGDSRLDEVYTMAFSGDLYEKYYLKKQGTLNRIPCIQFAYSNIASNGFIAYLIGVSPGNASNSFSYEGMGTYYKRYIQLKIDGVQLAQYIWEWGTIGLLIWAILFGRLFYDASKLKKSIYNMWFTGMVGVAMVGTIYNPNIMTEVLGYYFWFTAGIVAREYAYQKSKMPLPKETQSTLTSPLA
jgi:hypothetical protein